MSALIPRAPLGWRYVHQGYYCADHPVTDAHLVVRTRPLNDGWMAIVDHYVLGTGLGFQEAKDLAERVADAEMEA